MHLYYVVKNRLVSRCRMPSLVHWTGGGILQDGSRSRTLLGHRCV